MGLAKILLFLFNLIFVILGLAVIVSGILIFTTDQNFQILVLDSNIPIGSVGAVTIVLGIVVFIVAFTGCCGAIKENRCLLTVFIVLLCIILVLEIVGAILAFLYQGKLEDSITNTLVDGMDQYNKSADKDTDMGRYTQAWDFVQNKSECCGVNNFTDWMTYGDKPSPPKSCCNTTTEACTADMDYYQIGCKDDIVNEIAGNLIYSGTACIVILLAEIFGILFACCVLRGIDDGSKA